MATGYRQCGPGVTKDRHLWDWQQGCKSFHDTGQFSEKENGPHSDVTSQVLGLLPASSDVLSLIRTEPSGLTAGLIFLIARPHYAISAPAKGECVSRAVVM